MRFLKICVVACMVRRHVCRACGLEVLFAHRKPRRIATFVMVCWAAAALVQYGDGLYPPTHTEWVCVNDLIANAGV